MNSSDQIKIINSLPKFSVGEIVTISDSENSKIPEWTSYVLYDPNLQVNSDRLIAVPSNWTWAPTNTSTLKKWNKIKFIQETKINWITYFIFEKKFPVFWGDKTEKLQIKINSEDLQNQEHPVVQEIRDKFADTAGKIAWG